MVRAEFLMGRDRCSRVLLGRVQRMVRSALSDDLGKAAAAVYARL